MSTTIRSGRARLALTTAAVLTAACAVPCRAEPPRAPAPPAAPLPSAPPRPDDRDDRLADARARLERAAREIAALTASLAGDTDLDIEVLPDLARRGALGVQIATPSERGARGVAIIGVTPDGPAGRAGVRAGDLIVSLDGQDLTSESDPAERMLELMRDVRPGDEVEVAYTRGGARAVVRVEAEQLVHHLRLAPRAGIDTPLVKRIEIEKLELPFRSIRLGLEDSGLDDLELVALTPKLARYFRRGRSESVEGVLVLRAPSDAAWKLEDGDVILSIGDRVPTDPYHALRILKSYAPGETFTVRILRLEKPLTLEIEPPRSEQSGLLHSVPRERGARGLRRPSWIGGGDWGV